MIPESAPSAGRPLRRNLRQRRYRTRRQQQQSILPTIDVVKLGRWAGIIVLVSALALPIWRDVMTEQNVSGYPNLQIRLISGWSYFISIGAFGVIILLLAKLVDRLRPERT